MNILIADDDRVTNTLVAARLKAAGHKTTVAMDAMQVGMMAQRHLPDLVLLDVNMPGGSGIAALQRLKASNKTADIPVIVVTGSTDPDLQKKVQEMGAAGFLSKPLDFGKLEELLKRLTEDGSDMPTGSGPKS